jgi:hypothetical protein
MNLNFDLLAPAQALHNHCATISRKTGYKIFDRYQECGVQGLTDRSRHPIATPINFPSVRALLRKSICEKGLETLD